MVWGMIMKVTIITHKGINGMRSTKRVGWLVGWLIVMHHGHLG